MCASLLHRTATLLAIFACFDCCAETQLKCHFTCVKPKVYNNTGGVNNHQMLMVSGGMEEERRKKKQKKKLYYVRRTMYMVPLGRHFPHDVCWHIFLFVVVVKIVEAAIVRFPSICRWHLRNCRHASISAVIQTGKLPRIANRHTQTHIRNDSHTSLQCNFAWLHYSEDASWLTNGMTYGVGVRIDWLNGEPPRPEHKMAAKVDFIELQMYNVIFGVWMRHQWVIETNARDISLHSILRISYLRTFIVGSTGARRTCCHCIILAENIDGELCHDLRYCDHNQSTKWIENKRKMSK